MTVTPKQRITEEAKTLGFDAVGFATADPVPGAGSALETFIAVGRHGDMGWLATTADHRKSPRALWDEAKSVILLGVNYSRLGDPLAILQQRSRGAISIYAQGADYHEVIKAKLKQLATRARTLLGGDGEAARRQSGAWLAGQAHQSRLPRVRLMAVHRLDLHERSDPARRARAGSLRGLPALPRCLPDRRLHRSLSDRCARVHLIPHHRAQGAHRAALSRGHGQPHLRL